MSWSVGLHTAAPTHSELQFCCNDLCRQAKTQLNHWEELTQRWLTDHSKTECQPHCQVDHTVIELVKAVICQSQFNNLIKQR